MYEKHIVIRVFVQVPRLKKEGDINFVIDTGSGKSMLSANAAAHIGLNPLSFKSAGGIGRGFGGNFEARAIDCQVRFVFGKGTSEEYVVPYDGRLQVSMPPSHFSVQDQLRYNSAMPSLLGNDVLLKHFETVISKDRIELTPLCRL